MFPELVSKMKCQLRAEVVTQWDLYACLLTAQGVHWWALVLDATPAVSEAPTCVGPDDQMTTFTWSGMVRCKISNDKHPLFVARKYLAQWTLIVVQGVSRPRHNGPVEMPVLPTLSDVKRPIQRGQDNI